jgi:hypothetical protein
LPSVQQVELVVQGHVAQRPGRCRLSGDQLLHAVQAMPALLRRHSAEPWLRLSPLRPLLPPRARQLVTLVADEFHTLPGADYEQALGELAKYSANMLLAT